MIAVINVLHVVVHRLRERKIEIKFRALFSLPEPNLTLLDSPTLYNLTHKLLIFSINHYETKKFAYHRLS